MNRVTSTWDKSSELRQRLIQDNMSGGECKGTSIHFLTSPLLSYSPPVHMYSPPHVCTISRDHIQSRQLLYSKSDNFPDVDSPKVVDLPLLPPFVPQQHQMSFGCIGTCPHDTTAPSAVTRMAINGRLGTGRLGTVTLVYYL
jgi:hypothetical protein